MGEEFGGRQESHGNTRINRHLREQGEFAVNEARDLYDDQTPLPSTYVPISDQRNQALGQITDIAGADRQTGIGTREWEKVMSGAYLDPDSNPWMQEIVNRSVGSAMSAPQSGYAAGGRFGSGAMANAQADAGQNTAARLWGGNYNTERQNMMAAMGQTGQVQQNQYGAPTMLGKVGMEYEQDMANQQAEELRQHQYPYAKLEQFQSFLTGNPLMAESRTTATQVQPFQWGTALMGGLGELFSPSFPGMGGGETP
jgi:hypothetical protein